MLEVKRKQAVEKELAVLVCVALDGPGSSADPLDELNGLVKTAGAQIAAGMVQRRSKPHVTTFLGSGKVAELKRLVEFHDADVVIFDNDLSPAQVRNLEKELAVKVIDRTELILDIFATHATTVESRLAVELAQLEYSLPRLKRMWTHLSRIKMGVGMRGPGEKQLEVDRRLVEKRIFDLRSELNVIAERRQREVASRRDHMTVSLVGYTNAGKSTLMNALTNANVLAADKLFATLDTRTRRWQLPSWGPVLLSDTVGFIRDLPHKLIASFKATLEEARQADLLLHVADASSPQVAQQISAVYGVLEEIGIQQKDTLLVLNKIDKLESAGALDHLLARYPAAVPVSASARLGLDRLAQVVSGTLSRAFHDVVIETGVENGRLLAYLNSSAEVLSTKFDGDRARVHCRISSEALGRINDSTALIEPANGHAAFGNGYGQGPQDNGRASANGSTYRSADSPAK